MKALFRESFLKDVEALRESAVKQRVQRSIAQVKQAATLKDVRNLKRLKGSDSCYRIRIGDYRLGLVLEESAVVFTRCMHRKDIYRYFP